MTLRETIITILIILPSFVLGQATKLNYNREKINKEVIALINKISLTNEIHTEAIGFKGEKSKQYEAFEELIIKSSNPELIELINHSNSTVRGYAFWALAKKQYEKLDKIYIELTNDKEIVILVMGCMIDELTINEFITLLVTPNSIDLNCKKLNIGSPK